MKKIICAICLLGIALLISGCGNKNIEGTLPEIMEKLYAGVKEEEMPMMTENVELNDEKLKGYFYEGSNVNIKYKEAIASESMVGSMAHTVVLFRLENSSDAEKVVKEIEENANPRKWICVEAEHTYVLSKGDLVVLIMSNDLAPIIKENFENLK